MNKVKVYTGKNYILKTNKKGVASLNTKKLKKGKLELPRLCRSRGFLDLFFCATCLFGVFQAIPVVPPVQNINGGVNVTIQCFTAVWTFPFSCFHIQFMVDVSAKMTFFTGIFCIYKYYAFCLRFVPSEFVLQFNYEFCEWKHHVLLATNQYFNF